jgi:hypothetical protein
MFLQKQAKATRRDCRSTIPPSLSVYGKVRIDCGGDTVHARDLVRESGRGRDTSYLHVSTLFCSCAWSISNFMTVYSC